EANPAARVVSSLTIASSAVADEIICPAAKSLNREDELGTVAPATECPNTFAFARHSTTKPMYGSTYETPGILAISAIAASSRIRVGATFVGKRGPGLSPVARRAPDGRSRLPAAAARLFPNTVISLKRSNALNRESRFLCKPSPNETIVTMTATPTITPIEVSVARSLASRRFRKASLSRSRNGIEIRRAAASQISVLRTDARNQRRSANLNIPREHPHTRTDAQQRERAHDKHWESFGLIKH